MNQTSQSFNFDMALFGKKTKSGSKPHYKPTQEFLKVAEIRHDTLTMKDGTLRAILAVSSTNFDLKSAEEQDAIIASYQRFLNSLEFPVQILMQSRKMEIGAYTENLKRLAEQQTNELLRVQTTEYIEFINRLVESANVMNKNFYCVISLMHTATGTNPGFISRLLGTKSKESASVVKGFEKNKLQLDERVVRASNALSSMGLRVVRLRTNQLIELLYNSYNFAAGPQLNAQTLPDMRLAEEVEQELRVR